MMSRNALGGGIPREASCALCALCLFFALLAPPLSSLIVILIIFLNGSINKIEETTAFLSLALITSFKIASVNFYGGGANDFFYYYEAYQNVILDDALSKSSFELFGSVFGINLEIIFPLLFFFFGLIFPAPLSEAAFSFILTFIVFTLYYFALRRLIIPQISYVGEKIGYIVLLIAIVGLSDVIYYQLIRQGLSGGFVLLALTERRTGTFFIYYFLGVASHTSALFILPLFLLLRSRFSAFGIVGLVVSVFLLRLFPQLPSGLTTYIPQLGFYDFGSLGFNFYDSFNFRQNLILIVCALLLYFGSKFGSRFYSNIYLNIASSVGGVNSILFFACLFFAFGSITLLFDRVALLFISCLIWVHLGCYSVALRRTYLPHIFFLIVFFWKFVYVNFGMLLSTDGYFQQGLLHFF